MGDENDKPPAGYLYLREELRFEHQLLGSRMTYYMTSQSFLFTTAAIAQTMEWHGVYWFSGMLVPLVGVAASLVLLFSIHAAYGRLDEWRAKEKGFEGKHPPDPPVPGGQAPAEPAVHHPHAVAVHRRLAHPVRPDPPVPAARRRGYVGLLPTARHSPREWELLPRPAVFYSRRSE